MPTIEVLPSAVADQIAAGEVVERPASVVKELVENSLDAGASTIDIAIEEGGRILIRVSDDGVGMSSEDALLALQRHGTSKIRSAEDLTGVATFGFRGEALPAIGSVSRLELITARKDGEGVQIRTEAGGEPEVAEVARRKGTTVSVANLFFNIPARQKFLRGSRSEWRAITESLTAVALTRCDVRITVSHDGKTVLTLPAASSVRARLAAIWGGKYAEKLIEVSDTVGPIHVSGLVERPSDVGTATRRVFICVNSRAVRDYGIVRAAESAYRSTIPAGMRPSLFLNVELPGEVVDVNVHPAKAEVRFRDRWNVERTVENAVRRALGTIESSASMGNRFAYSFGRGFSREALPVSTDILHSSITGDTPLFQRDDQQFNSADQHTAGTQPELKKEQGGESTESQYVDEDLVIPNLRQLNRTYIMFEHENGMVLIDQHSAHERVLYEEFMRMLESGTSPSQRLLIPLTLHLGPTEADAFEENREYLEKLGFEVAGFGGNTILVNSVPMPHPRFDAERCLRDTLDSLTGNRIAGTAARHEKLAATVACKAAVKAGDILSQDEMRALFIALRDTELPAHDVHGRSTIVQLSWDEVDRRFGRS